MNKEFLKAIVELLMRLEDDQQNSVPVIFSDETIKVMNKVREYTLQELTK